MSYSEGVKNGEQQLDPDKQHQHISSIPTGSSGYFGPPALLHHKVHSRLRGAGDHLLPPGYSGL